MDASQIEVGLGRAMQAFREGRAPEAISQLEVLARAQPSHLDVRFALGMILGRNSRWAEADPHFQTIVEAQPRRPDALFWSAMAKRHTGHPELGANLCEKAILVDTKNAVLLNELGLCRLDMGQPEPASNAFSRAIALDPGKSTFRFNLGLALSRLDLIYKAKDAFEEAIRLDPQRMEAYLELARILETLELRDQSVNMLRRAMNRFPGDLVAKTTLAAALSYRGDSAEAETLYREAMESDPAYGHSMGPWLQQEGRFDESIDCFLTSLKAEPNQGVSYFGLTEAKVFRIDDIPLVDYLVPLLKSDELDLKGKTYAAYALARKYEYRRDYENAMRAFDRANAFAHQLHQAGRPFDRNALRKLNDRVIKQYSEEAVNRPREGASISSEPIFIVGMIRSGTTLLDQIISNHPAVKSAGEPVYWMREADRIRRLNQPNLSPAQLQELSSGYQSATNAIAGAAERITDKMPPNYAHLGLIRQVFPNAKIIHMRRNPLDTCLSIYTTFFGQGPDFAYNQSNIAFNYREYLRLMAHWRSILPTSHFMEVDYEALTADKEPIARQVIAFCELPWDDLCLSHEHNESAIRTPSKWQARQPMYRTSVERWRHYEPYLGDLLELRDLL